MLTKNHPTDKNLALKTRRITRNAASVENAWKREMPKRRKPNLTARQPLKRQKHQPRRAQRARRQSHNLQKKAPETDSEKATNGLRYPRVGERGQCLRCRKSPKLEKCLKIAQTPTRRVHALLGAFWNWKSLYLAGDSG
jgi:hypothetical protein